MTCDEAFEAMTDPTLRDTAGRDASGCAAAGQVAALRDHLASCPRCRQMEEVIRPALEPLSHAATWNPEPSTAAPWSGSLSHGGPKDGDDTARDGAGDRSAPLSWDAVARWEELAAESRAAARQLQTAGESAPVAAEDPPIAPATRWTRLRWSAAGLLVGLVGAVGLSLLVAGVPNLAHTATGSNGPAASICVWKRQGANVATQSADGTRAGATDSSPTNGAAPDAAQPTARQVALTCVACHLPTGP